MQNKYFTETRRLLRKKSTTAEKIMWSELRKFRSTGYIFRRQYSIDPYIVDFFCLKANLIIEIDGGIHNEPGHKDYDFQRDNFLKGFGYETLRIKNEEVMDNLETVIKKVKSFLH